MNPPRPGLRINLILASAAILALLAGLQTATQLAAWRYHFHPALGPQISGIYPPWGVFIWYRQWHHQAVFQQAAGVGLAVTLVLLCAVALVRMALANRSANTYSHGFWCKFQKRSMRGFGCPRRHGATRLPNGAKI